MTERKVYMGSVGPYLYEDTDNLNDADGDFSGQKIAAGVTDGVQVAAELIGFPVMGISVANIDDPSTGWTDSVSGMFEGVIEFDSTLLFPFRGVISLAIPDTANKYIDAARYHMLSLGVTIDNPFVQESSSACSLLLRWWDSNGEPGCSWYGCMPGYTVSNGWAGWSEIGPIDLNDIDSLNWGDDDVSELSLMFQAGDPTIWPADSLFSVRVGWIRLEVVP